MLYRSRNPKLSFDFEIDPTILKKDVDGWAQLTKDGIRLWNRRVRELYLYKFGVNTKRRPGLKTISTFGGTRIEKTNDGEILHLFADAKLSLRSTKKTESDKWNGILHMAEHGQTRPSKTLRGNGNKFSYNSGRTTIRPTKTLLAIPVNGTPRDTSPLKYDGTWIKSNKKNVWLFIQKNQGQTQRGRSKQGPTKEAARKKNKRPSKSYSRLPSKNKVLFIGVTRVKVRKGSKFYTNTIDYIFGVSLGELREISMTSEAGELLEKYIPGISPS